MSITEWLYINPCTVEDGWMSKPSEGDLTYGAGVTSLSHFESSENFQTKRGSVHLMAVQQQEIERCRQALKTLSSWTKGPGPEEFTLKNLQQRSLKLLGSDGGGGGNDGQAGGGGGEGCRHPLSCSSCGWHGLGGRGGRVSVPEYSPVPASSSCNGLDDVQRIINDLDVMCTN